MKLTDIMKKKIIADYIDSGNYSQVAKKYGVSRTTVAKVVKSDSESCEKLQQKKDENTKDVLDYMQAKSGAVCELIDLYLKALISPEKMQKASVQQIATALGIVIDKFTAPNTESDSDTGGVVIMPEVISDE